MASRDGRIPVGGLPPVRDPDWEKARQEEMLEDLPPNVSFPQHAQIWGQFPELMGILLHPRIRSYVAAEMHPQGEGWTAKKVRRILADGVVATRWTDCPNALVMVVQKGQNWGRIGMILSKSELQYQLEFLDTEEYGTKCLKDRTQVVDPTGRDINGSRPISCVDSELMYGKRKKENDREAMRAQARRIERNVKQHYAQTHQGAAELRAREQAEEEASEEADSSYDAEADEEEDEELEEVEEEVEEVQEEDTSTEGETPAPAAAPDPQSTGEANPAPAAVPAPRSTIEEVTFGDVIWNRDRSNTLPQVLYRCMFSLGYGMATVLHALRVMGVRPGPLLLEFVAGLTLGMATAGDPRRAAILTDRIMSPDLTQQVREILNAGDQTRELMGPEGRNRVITIMEGGIMYTGPRLVGGSADRLVIERPACGAQGGGTGDAPGIARAARRRNPPDRFAPGGNPRESTGTSPGNPGNPILLEGGDSSPSPPPTPAPRKKKRKTRHEAERVPPGVRTGGT